MHAKNLDKNELKGHFLADPKIQFGIPDPSLVHT